VFGVPLHSEITPLIITYNEAPNIERTLSKLLWARRIVIVDSGSSDETAQIARRYGQVDVIEHAFTDFASQCNFGLSRIETPWVLSLDADYELSDDLVREIGDLAPPENAVAGYRARFVYRVLGRPIRGALYPPRTVLYRKDRARYRNEGHGHRVEVEGAVRDLGGVIYHDDRKPLDHWFVAQLRYSREEAEYLIATPRSQLKWVDRIRLLAWPAPFASFFYILLGKGCLLDGWPGLYYALQRVVAETLIAIYLLGLRFGGKSPSGG
jgi:glycosyltransferase involved in cell wall biosynthesis